MNIEVLIQSGMLLVAVVTIIYTQYKDRQQNKIMMFSEYTRRYQEILIHMPESLFSDTGKLDEKAIIHMRLYFGLCSEEYYLWKNDMIPGHIWQMWKDGMQITTDREIYKIAWEKLKYNYNKDFQEYFNREVVNKKTNQQ